MKKLIILFLLFLITRINLSAQTEKGKFIFGGTTNINAQSGMEIISKPNYWQTSTYTNETKFFAFQFAPAFGYFILNNLAIGLSIPIEYYSEDKTDEAYTLMGAPFVRYFIADNNIKPYIQAEVGYGILKDNYDIYTRFGFGYSGGIVIFLNDIFALDISTGFTSLKTKEVVDQYEIPYTQKLTSLGLNVGVIVLL